MSVQKKCRHSTSWLMMGGRIEWCWGCGSIRHLKPDSVKNISYPDSLWCRPSGNKENPFDKWHNRSNAWKAKKEGSK